MKRIAVAIVIFFCGVFGAYAQNTSQAMVVSACGTPGRTYTAGTPGVITMDTNGNICFDSGGGAIIVNPPSVTPAAFTGAYSITLGATAQQLAAPAEISNNCVVQNPSTAAAQGIGAAESLFVNFVTTATLLSGGTTIELLPGVAVGCPGKTLLAISVNATTTGHKFGGYRD